MKRILSFSALFTSALSFAAVEHADYTDIYQNQRTTTLSETSISYVNNSSGINLALSAGLDRRLRLVTAKDGQITSDNLSSVIGIDDMITINERSFYGKMMTAPIGSDGLHNITIETQTLAGTVVHTEQFEVLRDTQAPAVGEMFINSYGGTTNEFTPPDVWYTGYYSNNYLQINDVDDQFSGVDKVEIVSVIFELDTPTEYKRRTLDYDFAQKFARFNFSSDSRFWLHDDNGELMQGVKFEITDRAGNVTETPIQKMYYDTVGAVGLELIGVREPGSTNVMGGQEGYVPYVPGAEVFENPISLLYRIPKDQHRKYVRGGYNAQGSTSQLYDVDDNYVYAIFTRAFNFKDSNHIKFSDQRQWIAERVNYNLVLAEGVPESPVRVGGAQYNYTDIGWSSWNRWRIQVDKLPIEILGSRQRVEPRPYVQRWSHGGYSCEIQPGDDICETVHDKPWVLSKGGSGYFHGSSSINSADNTLVGPPSWANVSYNDRYPPEITDYRVEGNILYANVYQEMAGSWFDNLRLNKLILIDENGAEVPATRVLKRTGVYYEAEWDLTTVPEGQYIVSIYAEEMHGLSDAIDGVHTFLNDTTPPVATFGYAGQDDVPETITQLRDIEIRIEDALSDVFIESLDLKSRDGTVDVALGYSLIAGGGKNKTFSPELPRLFPSLDPSKTYTITAVARDEFYNTVLISLDFSFIPDNLVTMKTQTSLPVSVEIQARDNQSVAVIRSEQVLILEDGRAATGPQEAIVTLTATSKYPVEVDGQTIKPGETKNIVIDLGPSGGELMIPVIPLAHDIEGLSDLMFEIPALRSMYE